MVKFSVFWRRQDDGSKEFLQNSALNQQQADANNPGDPVVEAAKLAERERLLTGDERIQNFLDTHPEYRAFMFALSPVNRTTKHISKSDARVAWLDFQILATLEEMSMSPEEYESGGVENIQGLEMYHTTQISDGFEGWKGKLVTENNKTIRTELKKVK